MGRKDLVCFHFLCFQVIGLIVKITKLFRMHPLFTGNYKKISPSPTPIL